MPSLMNSCVSKKQYVTFAKADAALKRLRRSPNNDVKRNLHIYSCNYCKKFHIGHVIKESRKHV